MRTLLGITAILVLSCGAAAADDKIDAAKLVGKWEPKEAKKGESMLMEFTKDGKLVVTGKMNDKDVKIEGTYKLEKDKLSFVLKFMDIEIKETVTLTKLTDDEMSGKDKDGKEESFKKLKAK
ncbi:MAG: TIGR03066 family protein [Gemmata sp.]